MPATDTAVDVVEDLYPENYDDVKADWNDYYWGKGEYTSEDGEPEDNIHEAILSGGFDDLLNQVMRDVVTRRNQLINAGVLKGKVHAVKSTDDYDDSQDMPRKLHPGTAQVRNPAPTLPNVSPVASGTTKPVLVGVALSRTNQVAPLPVGEVRARQNGNAGKNGPRSMVVIDGDHYAKSDFVGQHITFELGHKWNPSYLAGITGEIVDIGSAYFKIKVTQEPPAGTRFHRQWAAGVACKFNNDNLIPFLQRD